MGLLIMGFLFSLALFLFAMKLYGIYISFSKKWYLGLVSLIPCGFAEIVGIAKFVFKKDLLK